MKSTINTAAFQNHTENNAFNYLMRIAQSVENRAVEIIREKNIIDTGRLMGSITQRQEKENMRIFVGSNLTYASPVEFGTWASRVPPFDTHTKGMRPRPYLRPALDDIIHRIRGTIR